VQPHSLCVENYSPSGIYFAVSLSEMNPNTAVIYTYINVKN